ncbi:hypothetical protein REPUB_Repub12eG0029400 [Reevesia pubescens]
MNSCNGVVDNETIHKLESCLVGIARDYYEPCSLLENFKMSGVFDISVKKMSGKQFLIEFEDIEERIVHGKMNRPSGRRTKGLFAEVIQLLILKITLVAVPKRAVGFEKCDLVGVGLDDPELASQLGLDLEKVESQCNVFADGETGVVDLGQDCETLAFIDTGVNFFRAEGSEKEKMVKNKRGVKTIADIEDQTIERMDKKGRRRGKRKKNFFRTIQE